MQAVPGQETLLNAILERKSVLHVGCGRTPLPASFPREQWQEIRYDIDPAGEPDLVGDTNESAGRRRQR